MPKTITISREDVAIAKTMGKYNLDAKTATVALALAEARKAAALEAKLAKMVDVPKSIADAVLALVTECKSNGSDGGTTANVKAAFAIDNYVDASRIMAAARAYKRDGTMRMYPDTLEKVSVIVQ